MELIGKFKKFSRISHSLDALSDTVETLKLEHLKAIEALKLETQRLSRYSKADYRQLTQTLRELQNDSITSAYNTSKLRAPVPQGDWKRVLESANLKLVDIGGRGGPIPALRSAAPISHLISCEPEPEARETLQAGGLDKDWRSVKFFPEAIGPAGKLPLHVTRSPGLTSVLKPNLPVVERYFPKEDWEVEKTLEVDSIPLDEAARKYDFKEAAILKLDVQGYELEVLKSGPELIGQLDAIYLETEFQPFYEGQPVFSDIDTYLTGQGFTLVDLKRTLQRRRNNSTITYSKRELVWGHCLYLRVGKPTLEELSAAEARRLFTTCAALEYYDLAAAILEYPKHIRIFHESFGKDVHRLLREHAFEVGESLFAQAEESRKVSMGSPTHKDRLWER